MRRAREHTNIGCAVRRQSHKREPPGGRAALFRSSSHGVETHGHVGTCKRKDKCENIEGTKKANIDGAQRYNTGNESPFQLDVDPQVFEQIVTFLRLKKIADPYKRVQPRGTRARGDSDVRW